MSILPRITAGAFLLAFAAAAGAQNQIINPNLMRDVSPWVSLSEVTTTFWPFDANGSALSGSMHIENFAAAAGDLKGARQCFRIDGTRSYHVGALGHIPSGQLASGYMAVGVTWYSSPNCEYYDTVGYTESAPVATTGDWLPMRMTVTPPSGSYSVRVIAVVNKAQAYGSLIAWFDDVYFLDCDPQRSDNDSNGTVDAIDLVLLANKLVGNVGCLPTQ